MRYRVFFVDCVGKCQDACFETHASRLGLLINQCRSRWGNGRLKTCHTGELMWEPDGRPKCRGGNCDQ